MSHEEKLFCDVATDLGFITKEQAQAAVEAHRLDAALNQPKPIAAYLFEKNIVTREQVAQVLKMTDRLVAMRPAPAQAIPTVANTPALQVPGTAPILAAPLANPPATQATPHTSRTAYVLLGLFLGCLGVHNFYAGYAGRGVAQLLITLVLGWFDGVGLMITAVWALIEIVSVDRDARGVKMA